MGEKKVMDTFAEFPIPTYDEWRKVTEKALKGASFEDKLLTKTYEGITLRPMYQQKDVEQLSLTDNIPGEAPFIRGTEFKQENCWEVNQELAIATPEKFNETALSDLARGQTSLNIVLDDATKKALPVTNAKEVGKTGLLINNVDDIAAALKSIDLTKIPIQLYSGANALPIFSQLFAYLQKYEINTQKLSGCIGMDPIGELVEHGEIAHSLNTCYDVLANISTWTLEHAPKLQTVLVRGTVYHNGGSSAVEELSFSLATAVQYVATLIERGLSINEAAAKIRFEFAIGVNYFMEIAKLRAARVLWSTVIAAFGGDEEAQKMTIHARTSAWTKTKYDPYVNMLRSTSEAFAAAVGGADSIHVSPFDEPIQKATTFSRRIARNTSIILQEEAHIGKTIDPAGGSWYVETLTTEMAEKSWQLFQQVEEQGGIVASLQQNFPQEIVSNTLKQRLKNIEHRKDIFVGTNMYVNLSEKPLEAIAEDEQAAIAAYLQTVEKHPSLFVDDLVGEKIVEKAIAAAKKGATVRNIAEALKDSDTPITIQPIKPRRATEKIEKLREAMEAFTNNNGKALSVFLANLGSLTNYKARADFATGFFEVGGFSVITNNGFENENEAAEAALESGAQIVVICGDDASYEQHAAEVAKIIKAENDAITIILAGKPTEENEQVFRAAGIDQFIHLRSNCYETLRELQVKKGGMEG